MFAYCNNNPVIARDSQGTAAETVFDIISLAFSVADVIANPKDPWAWAGLVGDVIDLIPFVTGVGEVTKVVGTAARVADAVDDAVDSAKVAGSTINRVRRTAVRQAWHKEAKLVRETGKGTREWAVDEIAEICTTGKVKGYVGHHMKSVRGYPELAGVPNNIQFLTYSEHLAAHGGNWRNVTHGRYIP